MNQLHIDSEVAASTSTQTESEPDFRFVNHGSVYLLQANSESATTHLAEHVPADALWWGKDLVVEHRYWLPLAMALQREGYTVKVD